MEFLKTLMSPESIAKLEALENPMAVEFIEKFAKHCNPDSIYVCDDSEEDKAYIRRRSLERGEEHQMSNPEQTIHWDGYYDQARDKVNTRYMVYPENMDKMRAMNSLPYDQAEEEIMGIAKDIMKGKEAYVKFFTEGPADSPFTIPCLQFSDSAYVMHAESLLYRGGYQHFLNDKGCTNFYRFIHSAGELDELGCVKNLEDRRIYMDTQNNIVYSMNAQYAGNTVGLKKHSMRLAINQSGQEGWLTEHMFLMGIIGPEGRKTYFTGAYPSACGKTSTAMLPGEVIVGDDIIYARKIDNEFRAVNVEQGNFGILTDVNEVDDPVIFENCYKNQEMIFSNVLRGDQDKLPYWQNQGFEPPAEGGRNHFGNWKPGVKDEKGNVVPVAHGNARYTMRLDYLANFDKEGFSKKEGVKVQGVLYGGRDSDTTVPVEESPSWRDGILLKACTLESETTAATLGAEGVRTACPMANMDFLSYPLGEYTLNNLKFVEGMKEVPKVFSTNYFMRNAEGKFMTGKLAKKVWLHWAEGRVHGEFDAYDTPTGKIPLYKDLKVLFKDLLKENFTEEDYTFLFTFRTQKWINKIERTIKFFASKDPHVPAELNDAWNDYIAMLKKVQEKYGDEILPGEYKGL